MSSTDDLLARAKAYADAYEDAGLPAAPSARVAILSCMDARFSPYAVLGLQPGEAHVIRNAGGIVDDDAIRSLSISQHKLGTEEIILMHHTGCGLLTFTDDAFANDLEAETGHKPAWRAGAFTNLEDDVADGIQKLKDSPFIPNKGSIRGFVYSVEDGALTEV